MASSWRSILAEIIEDPKKKKEIADQLGIVSPRTLDHWVEGTHTPRNSQIIKKLSTLLPNPSQQEMAEALQSAFPEAFKVASGYADLPPAPQSAEERIHYEVYKRVLHAYTTIPAVLREWTITNLVIGQMIRQLDPAVEGIAVMFARCIPTRQKIQHLLIQENGGGTAWWDTRQIVSQCSVGIESFIGRAVASGRPHFIQALASQEGLPEHFFQREHIQSLAISPIQRVGTVAGGILICAAQPDFFTARRKELIDDYTHLFGLAFADQDFYPLQDFGHGKS